LDCCPFFNLDIYFPNLHILPQTKNPTNVGLDVRIFILLFMSGAY